jgi:hypothetical protein
MAGSALLREPDDDEVTALARPFPIPHYLAVAAGALRDDFDDAAGASRARRERVGRRDGRGDQRVGGWVVGSSMSGRAFKPNPVE